MTSSISCRPASRAIRAVAGRFGAVAFFSAVVNLLMLNGSLYMLQVYDRVLVSRSVPTLVTVTLLMLFLFAVQALVDLIRQRLAVAIGREVDARLRADAHAATLAAAARGDRTVQAVNDLDSLRSFLSGSAVIAFLDLPWAPAFIALAFLVHPAIGWATVAAMVAMIGLTLLSERLSRRPTLAAGRDRAILRLTLETERRHAETAHALGLVSALTARHARLAAEESSASRRLANITGGFGAVSRIARQLIQSLLLGLGAYLVIEGDVTAGATLASSIMVGRALAPIDQVIACWPAAIAAGAALRRLNDTLAAAAPAAAATTLPLPCRSLAVEAADIAAVAGGPAVVAGVGFTLAAGDVLAITGPSGSGKTALLRALAGITAPVAGEIRLDGARLDHYDRERLGRHVGYVAQTVGLFDGTIAENIARMTGTPRSEAVIAAARAAGVHDMILDLPAGYDTLIGDATGPLSGGQRQRIALARAFYGNPFLILLDEANANLDIAGETAFAEAVKAARARGAIVILATHRPATLAVATHVLVLAAGRQQAFGPRDAVLKPAAPANLRPLRANG